MKHVDYEEYKIEKQLKTHLVEEYKVAYHDLIDKRLQIDCAMSVAATLTSKEESLYHYWFMGGLQDKKFLMLELGSLKQDSY